MDVTAELLRALRRDRAPEPVFTVLGDLGYDYIYTAPALEAGKEVIIRGLTRTIAGAAGYFACGSARLGATVHFLTELGDDADGSQLLAEAGERGIQTGGIRQLENTRSYFTLIFADEAESSPRQVATYLGPLAETSLEDLDYGEYLSETDLLYSCNYFLLKKLRSQIDGAFARARERGILTAYDANAGDGWEETGNLQTLRERIYPHTDVVFLNEMEAYCLTGERDPLKAVMKAGPDSRIVVVKCGAAGCVVRDGGEVFRCPAFPLRRAVQDTVGAGDSFQAAFLYFHMRGLPARLAAVLAAVNAAATVQEPGGVLGQQDREGLAAMLEHTRITMSDRHGLEIEMR